MKKILVVAAVFLVAFSGGAMSKKANSAPAQQKAELAPDFSLKTPEGKPVILSAYKGKVARQFLGYLVPLLRERNACAH